MAKVTNLKIQLQSGSDGTHFASWEFNESTKTTTSNAIKTGSYVTIKGGATYYNGVSIPSWVMSDSWQVVEISGDRVVLGRNKSGSNNIQSAISSKYLNSSSGSSSTVTTNTLDHYTVTWSYDTGDGIWFSDGSSDVKVKNSTYSAPNNALRIKVSVKPVSKTHKVNDKDVSYWSGTSVSATYSISYNPPSTPSTPSVEIDKFKLTASLENIEDSKTDQIEFEVYNNTTRITKGVSKVVTRKASYSCSISAGGNYRVRCRAINLVGSSKKYSEWSDYSSSLGTIPTAPSKITTCKATSDTSVYLEWNSVSTATSYELEYTTKKEYFDGSDQVTSVSGIEFNHYEKTGFETGQQYFFRVRAVNDQGNSGWSSITSIILGEKPSAPTTWSSTSTAIVGEDIYLYWVHNSVDGSRATYSELELYIDGQKESHTIENTTPEDEDNNTTSYTVKTDSYTEGTKIEWRVRTAGITKQYGDWSIQRVIHVYAEPTIDVKITNADGEDLSIIESFPIYISALTGPKTQAPIGYNVTISANSGYYTTDYIGNSKYVSAGEVVFSRYFDTNEPLLLELSASNIDLENNVDYDIVCTASMNSGLTAEATVNISVSWTDKEYEPDVEIAVDTNSLVAYVRPYCVDSEGVLYDDVLLSVYRREFDGTFTELGFGLENSQNTMVTDPHPALDYARYRVVAISKSTGAISFYDPPGYPVNEHAVVLQWDEEWTNFDSNNEEAMDPPPWTGSMLKLPYNIDTSEDNKVDVTLVSYIGRVYPVSYYGTSIDSTASWSMEIDKKDSDTIYALRRLSIWKGDVYVREPSGSGYWASLSVSFSRTHKELTIPVTLSITRVDGGA